MTDLPIMAWIQTQRSTAHGNWELWPGFSLADPWFLVLLVLVPFVVGIGGRLKRQAVMSAPATLSSPGRSVAQRWAFLLPLCSSLSLVLGILALSRPLAGNERYESKSEGVDIALVLDRSTSMEEGIFQGSQTRKFDVARKVVAEFAVRRTTDRDNAADQVALFGFARFTELLCPFTTDADALVGVIQELDMEYRQDLDSTAIGVAIAKAVDVLDHSEAASRIVVLLTDGEERTRNIMEPLAAAAIAESKGIRVYTIFVGPASTRVRTLLGDKEIRANVSELQQIAKLTNGLYFQAEDEEQLEEAYAQIEELERTPREDSQYAEHYELYRPFVLASLLLGAIAMLARHTWARRLPC